MSANVPSSHARSAHELRVVDIAHLVGITVGGHRRGIRGNDGLRRIQEIVQKHRRRGESFHGMRRRIRIALLVLQAADVMEAFGRGQSSSG
jgi:hypothetical protein